MQFQDMYSQTLLVAFVVVVVTTTAVNAEIFTSSLKVERMVMEEEHLLTEFKRYIDIQYEKLKAFSNFYSDRLRDVRLRKKADLNLKHPNSVYKIIKRFATDYAGVLGDQFAINLQNVYNLNALDMARGDYLGYQGPQLEVDDAYEIAQTAFT
ncbi:unnamed protein product, partial [Candidula unifasciata]